MTELEQKPPGRRKTPEHELKEAELQQQVEELKKEKVLLEKQLALKDLVHQIKRDEVLQRGNSAKRKDTKKKR